MKNFKVIRRVGVGDRERVRAGLLQVLCASPINISYQISQALRAAKTLKRTLRIYFNSDLIPKKDVDHCVMVIMGRARDHDIMVEKNVDEKRFDWILNSCDICILPSDTPEPELYKSIINICADARPLNVYGMSISQAKKVVPDLYGNEDTLWQLFKGHDEVR